jgi:hypothetical protein
MGAGMIFQDIVIVLFKKNLSLRPSIKNSATFNASSSQTEGPEL